ncbi:hypothetical protein [Paeniglutamicibacter antarcticus]
MAVTDASGEVLNLYSRTHPITQDAPTEPWAVNLTDSQGLYRLLAFDFDAKDASSQAQAAKDADALSRLLDAEGIAHVVCASGPTGGRHLWIALAEPVSQQLAADFTESVKLISPTLDPSPLANPATGCVRPPGAPHRLGGTSHVLRGDTTCLTHPTVTAEQLTAVATKINQANPTTTQTVERTTTTLPVDETGNVYLPGAKRALPAVSAAALAEGAPSGGDASATLWRVLIGAAAARWQFSDIATHLGASPGLEHARTIRVAHGSQLRRPRPARGPGNPTAVLRAQWLRAVRHVAVTPRQIGEDPTFDMRAETLADYVSLVQARADSNVGRWIQGGGPADRRVLDVLCMLALQALNVELEADIRRLALLAGIGRETARTALLRLAADGWIKHTQAADGPHGSRWTIDPQDVLHREVDSARSQAVPRPPGAGTAKRTNLLAALTTRSTSAQRDVYSPAHGLGLHAGNIYARITEQYFHEQSVLALPRHDARTIRRLEEHGLIRATGHGWIPTTNEALDRAAVSLGVAGNLADREARYTLEREVWGWWRTEQEWMKSAGRQGRRKRPTVAQPTLAFGTSWDLYPAYPRTIRRGDHHAAVAAVRAGALSHLQAA